MSALATIPPKVLLLLPRLASDQEGEVLATAKAIGKQLSAVGADWHDLVSRLTAEPAIHDQPHREYHHTTPDNSRLLQMARFLRDSCAARLNARCDRFVVEMANALGAGRSISVKQRKFLMDLYAQHGGAA